MYFGVDVASGIRESFLIGFQLTVLFKGFKFTTFGGSFLLTTVNLIASFEWLHFWNFTVYCLTVISNNIKQMLKSAMLDEFSQHFLFLWTQLSNRTLGNLKIIPECSNSGLMQYSYMI